MSEQTATPAATASEATPWGWVGISLAAHTAWGSYPVLARFLQIEGGVPTFSLLMVANLIVLVFLARSLLHHTDANVMRLPIVWLFALIVILRATTNIASTRFTLSIYVQLVTQATPFAVILLSTALFREKLPRFTIPAVTLALIGAVLMIGTNFGSIPDAPPRRDWLGVGLAIFSVMMLATYMVLVRRTTQNSVSSETLLLIQLVVIVVVSGAMSLLLREDWGQYTQMRPLDWAMLLTFAFGVFMGGNLGQIQAIRHLGAPFYSSMLASRLVSALIFGWLLLGERLTSAWQIVGAAIVLITITWYLWQQH